MRSTAPDWVPEKSLAALAEVLQEMWPGHGRRMRLDARLAVADVLWALGWDRSAALSLVGRPRLLNETVAAGPASDEAAKAEGNVAEPPVSDGAAYRGAG